MAMAASFFPVSAFFFPLSCPRINSIASFLALTRLSKAVTCPSQPEKIPSLSQGLKGWYALHCLINNYGGRGTFAYVMQWNVYAKEEILFITYLKQKNTVISFDTQSCQQRLSFKERIIFVKDTNRFLIKNKRLWANFFLYSCSQRLTGHLKTFSLMSWFLVRKNTHVS